MTALPWVSMVLATVIFAGCRREESLAQMGTPAPQDTLEQTYWTLPDFSLTERTGQSVTLENLKGKVWVADFFYSTCPGPCPMLSSRLSALQDQLGNDDRVRLVSISSDPEKDTPEVLTQYATRFKANERWLFLTGAKPAIRDLAFTGFKVPIADNPGGAEPIIHSTRLVLVDQHGAVRAMYEGVGEDSSAQIVRDVRRLLENQP